MSQSAGEPGSKDFVEVRLPAAGAYCRCCGRPRPVSRPGWTSPSTRSRICGSPSTRRARSCCSRPCPARVLSCVFGLVGDSLWVTVSAPTTDGRAPERDTFAWTVLSALAGEVDSTVAEDRTVSISLHKKRGAVGLP